MKIIACLLTFLSVYAFACVTPYGKLVKVEEISGTHKEQPFQGHLYHFQVNESHQFSVYLDRDEQSRFEDVRGSLNNAIGQEVRIDYLSIEQDRRCFEKTADKTEYKFNLLPENIENVEVVF